MQGGGQPTGATGVGSEPSKLDEAMEAARKAFVSAVQGQ